MPKPRICVSVMPTKMADLKPLITRASRHKPDLIELRMDHLREDEIQPPRLDAVRSKCIITLRKPSQGGYFKGNEETRLRLLAVLTESKPAFIDLELETAEANPQLPLRTQSLGSTPLISWHDFNGTPSDRKLDDVAGKAKRLSRFIKIVTTAHTLNDNIRMLNLIGRQRDVSLVAFCMGEKGLLSRVLAPLAGSPFTYASLGDATTAPGQISIGRLSSIYAALNIPRN